MNQHRITTVDVTDPNHPKGVMLTCECGWEHFVDRVECVTASSLHELSPVKRAIDAHWASDEPKPLPNTEEVRLARALASCSWALGMCSGKLDQLGGFDDQIREAVERAMACINALKEGG